MGYDWQYSSDNGCGNDIDSVMIGDMLLALLILLMLFGAGFEWGMLNGIVGLWVGMIVVWL